MVIANIIYTAFMVWLICLFFAFPESLWEARKIKYRNLNSFPAI